MRKFRVGDSEIIAKSSMLGVFERFWRNLEILIKQLERKYYFEPENVTEAVYLYAINVGRP